jgi:hypothetical protein
MSTSDDVMFEESIDQLSVDDINPTTNEKRVNFITDQNNGSYSGEITFDATPLVGGDQYISWKEAFIQIPFSTIMTNSSGADLAAIPKSYAVGIKNGWYQFIDSISVYVNGKELVSQTPYSNMIINAMTMMKMSQDELQLKGATLGVCPDNANGMLYSAAATISGDGFYNNVNGFTTAALASAATYSDWQNRGMYDRQQKTTAFTPTTCTLTSMNTAAKAKLINKNHHIVGALAASGTAGTWNYMVNLPLNILSDLFDKYPLVKGGQVRIVLRYNAGSTTITAGASPGTLAIATHTQTYGHTNPLMVGSITAGGVGLGAASSTPTVLTLTSAVSTSAFNISSARLYATSYRLNPQYEARLLSSTPKKEVRYLDVFNQNINTIATGSSVNQILTTSITNPKYVMVLPFCASASNSTVMAAQGLSQYHSVFDSAPSTTLPFGSIACQNFQVNVANKNMFQSSLNYNFEMFQNEIQKLGLNGGIGQCSGLLDINAWSAHSYMVCDVSRRLIEDDGSRKSISVSFTNNSGLTCDYVCFILYEKVINVDLTTGDVERIQ